MLTSEVRKGSAELLILGALDARRWRALRETVEHRDARLPG
ncbi:MAG: hypothetical protein R2752_14235 [Vicinamibacterales bacterium]